VTFSSEVIGGGDAANFELRNQGPDGILGNGDDVLVTLAASYAPNTTPLSFSGLAEGVYRLTVEDTILSTAGPALDGDGDGTAGGDWVRDFVGIAPFESSVPYRWQTFNTYDNATGSWLMGNNAAMSGGVNPSTWTDGNATAQNMSADLGVLSTFFTNKGYAGKNAMIWSEVEATFSSTNGEIGAALFRIQNSTGSAINWTPSFYYSSFGAWNEWAGVAVNGVNVWTSGGSNTLSSQSVTLSIPANSTSTVIFTSSLGPAFAGLSERAGQLGFFNNSLQLPAGLAFVDDLVESPSAATLVSTGGYPLDVDLRAFGAGQLIQGPSNAFDGLNRLQANGADFAPAAAATSIDGGRTIVTAASTLSGLSV
jgi:hypothetical protein